MTYEQFEKAKELYDEKELALGVEALLLNWNGTAGVNKLTMIWGPNSFKADEVLNQVDRCSPELKERLVKVCRDYIHELDKQFEEI